MTGPLREGAYSGGSRMAAPWPDRSEPLPDRPEPDQPEPDEPEPDEPEPDEDEPDEDEGQGDEDAGRSAPRVPAGVQDGAGWVLGLMVWGWVVLPFLRGGPARVKATLLAKFFNKAPDGSWLP